MTKLCTLTIILLLALQCGAEQGPAAVTPQQVDEIVGRLLARIIREDIASA